MYFSPNYDLFQEEERFKNNFLSELILDERNINGELVRLNSSLIERCGSLTDKRFNMPLMNGNRAIKMPLYDIIGEIDSDEFLFKPSLEKYDELAETYEEISKTNSGDGTLRDFFIHKSKEIDEYSGDSGNPHSVEEK